MCKPKGLEGSMKSNESIITAKNESSLFEVVFFSLSLADQLEKQNKNWIYAIPKPQTMYIK